jgi:hypothetical protein
MIIHLLISYMIETRKVQIPEQSWTVILHFERGSTLVYTGLSKEEAQKAISTVVFNNQDCINFSCFRVK